MLKKTLVWGGIGVGILVVACAALALLSLRSATSPTTTAPTRAPAAAAPSGAATSAPSAGSTKPTKAPAPAQPTAAPEPTAAQPTAAPEPTAAQPTAAPEPTAAPAVEPGSSRSAPLPLGTDVRLKTWSIVIAKVERGQAALDAITKANQFNKPPEKGFEYLLATIKATNIGTDPKAQDPIHGIDLRPTGEKNILYNRAFNVFPPQPFRGDLLPEATAEGQFVFVIPSDEKNLMFRVKEFLLSDQSLIRFVAIDPDAQVALPADLAAATDAGKTRESPARVGDAVTTDSYQLTVLEFVRGKDAADKIKAATRVNQPAKADQEYILVRIHVRWLDRSEPDRAVQFSSLYFKAIGEKDIEYDHPHIIPPMPRFDAMLFPGGEDEGWVALSVAPGEKGLVMKVKPLGLFAEELTRYIALE